MDLRYETVDVFTDRVFGGNPLAVFPEAEGLSDSLMQSIAQELNLAETVFLSPPTTSEGTRRVRIFTPRVEVPFAGHPTVGTALYLAWNEVAGEPAQMILEENVGPVPVEIEYTEGRAIRARFTAAIAPEHRPVPWSVPELAQLISLDPDEIGCPHPDRGSRGAVTEHLDAEMVSLGLPFIVVPVRDLSSARRAQLDTSVWRTLTEDQWSRMVYIVTSDSEGDGVAMHVRMFAPSAGVGEDPATGSAAAALAAYLGARSPDGKHCWEVEQGIEIGRPSLLSIDAQVTKGVVTRVRVAGSAVPVASGVMTIPEI